MSKRNTITRFLRGWWPEKPSPNAKSLSFYHSVPLIATLSTLILLAVFEGSYLPRALPPPIVQSQPSQPSLLFQKTWGGTGADLGVGVATDAAGNAYVGGTTYSFGSGIPGQSSLSLLKYNASGGLVWQKTWIDTGGNGSASPYASGVAVDAAGSIFVAGSTSGSGAGNLDVLLLKFASNGTLLWERTWGGSSNDFGRGVAVDPSGNIYVTGDTDSFGVNRDVFLLKFNSNGELLWQKTWGGSNYDIGSGVATDSSGNVYVTGGTWSFGVGNTSLFLLKFDSSGTLLWQKTWGGAVDNHGYGVAVDALGGVYVTGYTDSFGTGESDVLLLKFNATGGLLWQRTWGGPGTNFGYGVAVGASESIYVTGITAGSGDVNFQVPLLVFNSTGSLMSQITWGGSNTNYGYGVVVDTSGQVLVTGSVREAPPYTLSSLVSNALGTPSWSLGSPSFTTGSPNFIPGTPTGSMQTPNGSQSYAGEEDEFLFKYGEPPTVTFQTNPTNGGSITFNGTSYSNGMNVNSTYGTVSISAHPPAGYEFSGWTGAGGVSVAESNSNSTLATIAGPGRLSASFATQPAIPLYLGGIFFLGLAATVSVALVRHRRR